MSRTGLAGKITSVLKNENCISLYSYGVYAFFEAAVIYILAHTYDKEMFGEWTLFYSINILLDKLIFGIGSFSLTKFLSESVDSQRKEALIGSSWAINGVIILLLSVVSFSALIFSRLVPDLFSNQNSLVLLFLFFPLIALLRLPFNQSLAILQSRRDFWSILILRLVGMGAFTLFCIVNIFFRLDLFWIVFAYTLSNVINSLLCIIRKWSGIELVGKRSKEAISQLLAFGKYSMGTFIGFNILRESAVILIAFFMSKEDAALFVIPLRLIDILYVPLLGFVAVALPRISEAFSKGDNEQVRMIFCKYTGSLIIAYIPAAVLLYFLAWPLIWFFGGSQYSADPRALAIFNILLVYSILLPIDSMAGTTLDAINKPKYNFIKVFVMLGINVAGIIAVIALFRSVIAVPFILILNLLAGIVIGILFLKKQIQLKVSDIFGISIGFYKKLFFKIMGDNL